MNCPTCGATPRARMLWMKFQTRLKTLSNGCQLMLMGDGHVMLKRPMDYIDSEGYLIDMESV